MSTDSRSSHSLPPVSVQLADRRAERPGRESRPDSEQVLARLTVAAVASVPGADYAGLTMREQDRLVSRAPSDPRITDVDQLQVIYGEGPCVDALDSDTDIVVEDFTIETRWPRFGPAAADRGIASLVSFALAPDRAGPGALNLYSTRPHAFDDTSRAIAAVFAAQAAVAVDAVHTIAGLEGALASRDTIGQAKGILVQRLGVDSDQAFALLVRYSQQANIKLATIARRIVTDANADASRPGPARQ